ncbi:MAG: Flp family type IVb pilin [Proteobacteria bacterium]|nr:Flp family type IVb pilin [Pseudomonadota bacterium]
MLGLYVNLSEKIRKFAADKSGVTAIEYGLIAAGIAVAIITAVGLLGDELSDMFDDVTAAI